MTSGNCRSRRLSEQTLSAVGKIDLEVQSGEAPRQTNHLSLTASSGRQQTLVSAKCKSTTFDDDLTLFAAVLKVHQQLNEHGQLTCLYLPTEEEWKLSVV